MAQLNSFLLRTGVWVSAPITIFCSGTKRSDALFWYQTHM